MDVMDRDWKAWVRENLDRGVDRNEMVDILLRHGFTPPAIRKEMGQEFPGTDSAPARVEEIYRQLCAPALTRRKTPGLRREPATQLQLYIWQDFLSPDECSQLIEASIDRVRPSTVTQSNGDPYYRTSSTCDLVEVDHPIVAQIDDKISQALGINLTYSEAIQAQKYEVGQEFKTHTDYFEPGTDEFRHHAAERGQRTWTFMIYLNTTPKGGATHFTDIKRKVKPKAGRAVIWNNLTKDGAPNPHTSHHGMPVEEGEKIIITKWFRDKGQGAMFIDD